MRQQRLAKTLKSQGKELILGLEVRGKSGELKMESLYQYPARADHAERVRFSIWIQ